MEVTSDRQPSTAPTSMELDSSAGVGVDKLPPKPKFAALSAQEMDGKVEFRRIPVPPHRYSPLKKNWMEIYNPVYEQMKIDIRMNLKVTFSLINPLVF